MAYQEGSGAVSQGKSWFSLIAHREGPIDHMPAGTSAKVKKSVLPFAYAPTTLLTVGDAGPGPPSFIGTTYTSIVLPGVSCLRVYSRSLGSATLTGSGRCPRAGGRCGSTPPAARTPTKPARGPRRRRSRSARRRPAAHSGSRGTHEISRAPEAPGRTPPPSETKFRSSVRSQTQFGQEGRVLGRVVGLAGFEPAASSSRTKRSTKLSHSPWKGRRTLVAGSRAVNGSFQIIAVPSRGPRFLGGPGWQAAWAGRPGRRPGRSRSPRPASGVWFGVEGASGGENRRLRGAVRPEMGAFFAPKMGVKHFVIAILRAAP